MLILSRRVGESVVIGEDISITVRSTRMLDGADRTAQFGQPPQPADRGIAGIGPLGHSEIVEHAMAVIGPEHNLVISRTISVFRKQRF